MSSPSSRRPVQRLGLVGIGSAVLLVGIALPAGAATDVVIPLAPPEIALAAFPVENYDGAMDPMAGPGVLGAEAAQYGDDLTLTLPTEFDTTGAEVALVFPDTDADADDEPDRIYSSAPGATDPLPVAGEGGATLTITLPADDTVNGPSAELLVSGLATTLGTGFVVAEPVSYLLELDTTARAQVDLQPLLIAASQVPCAVTSPTPCPFPTPVTAGSTVTLELPTPSLLRDLGITDLTGTEIGLAPLDAAGQPTAEAALLAAEITGSTATFDLPAGTAPGSYGLVVVSPVGTTGASVLAVELTVVAPETVAPPAEETTTTTTATNAGLRSNTGVEAVETGSTGNVAVVAGAGMLLLAGAGGVAVARNRRRPAAEGGTCGA